MPTSNMAVSLCLQVLCLLKRLSHLTAASFHHCIHLMPSLELPSLRCLHISHVSRLALQQQPQQQQGAPVAVQVVQALAGQPLGGAAAAAAPAAGPLVGVGNIAAAVAAGAVPVVPLSALPVFVSLQQQQQEEHAQYLLVGPQGQPALLRQQQQPSTGGGSAVSIQQHAGHLPLHAHVYGPQAAAAGVAAVQQQQQPVLPNGISLQLLQLRQQQLYLQQQQLRLQEQQVQLQLQQMQAQLLQQGQQPQQHVAFNGAAHAFAAADIAGAQQQQQQQQPLAAALIMQQGPAAPAAAANGAVPCVQHKGWLAVLFPGLEEFHLASARELPAALPALQGHQSLQSLVIGTYRPIQQQSAQRGKVALPQAGILAGVVTGGTSSRVLGLQAAAAAASGGCAGAPWGMLRTLACLEELVIHEAGA